MTTAPTGHEILDLPLQAVLDGIEPRTIRGFLTEVIWAAWHQGETGAHTPTSRNWRAEMAAALQASGLIQESTPRDPAAESATVTDLIDSAIRAMNEPYSGVDFDDIREGDMIRATVSGRAACGNSSGIYLQGEVGYNSAWVCHPVLGEPVTFERLKSVPRGASRDVLLAALDALVDAHPERRGEAAVARSVIANRLEMR